MSLLFRLLFRTLGLRRFLAFSSFAFVEHQDRFSAQTHELKRNRSSLYGADCCRCFGVRFLFVGRRTNANVDVVSLVNPIRQTSE